jgi:hypothetical protein
LFFSNENVVILNGLNDTLKTINKALHIKELLFYNQVLQTKVICFCKLITFYFKSSSVEILNTENQNIKKTDSFKSRIYITKLCFNLYRTLRTRTIADAL